MQIVASGVTIFAVFELWILSSAAGSLLKYVSQFSLKSDNFSPGTPQYSKICSISSHDTVIISGLSFFCSLTSCKDSTRLSVKSNVVHPSKLSMMKSEKTFISFPGIRGICVPRTFSMKSG